MCFITQHPSKIPLDILSQIGTHCVFRLADLDDRGIVQRLLPPTHKNLVPTIGALPTGECVIMGDAVDFPVHLRIPLIKQKTIGIDPELADNWKKPRENLFPNN